MHSSCFAGCRFVCWNVLGVFYFCNLERGTHDAGTFQRSELRTLRRKLKNPLLQCFDRTQILAYVSLEPFTYIQLWCFQIAQAFDRAERAEEEPKQAHRDA